MNEEVRALAVMLCAVNPAAVTLAARGRLVEWPVAAATLVVAGVLIVLAGTLARPLVDALDTTASSFGLAAGVVMLATGTMTLIRPAGEPQTTGSWRDGLFPLGFPLVFNPAVAMGVLHLGASEGAALGIVTGLAAGGVAVGTAAVVRGQWSLATDALARLTAAALVLLAVTIVVESVKTV